MEEFQGLNALIDKTVGKEINGWIWVNLDQLNQNAIEAEYYLIDDEYLWELDEDEVYENEQGDELPLSLKDKNLKSWLEIPMIEDVISYLKHNTPKPNIELIEKALKYYFENDAFLDT